MWDHRNVAEIVQKRVRWSHYRRVRWSGPTTIQNASVRREKALAAARAAQGGYRTTTRLRSEDILGMIFPGF